MFDVFTPLLLSLVTLPAIFQFGVGFSLIPRRDDPCKYCLIPFATVIMGTFVGWLIFRVLLAPVSVWALEAGLLFLLVYSIKRLSQSLVLRMGLPVPLEGSEGEARVFDAFPWLSVSLSLSFSWSLLSALLFAFGCLCSFVLASLGIRLIEWRTRHEKRPRGIIGAAQRLLIAAILSLFWYLLARLVFPGELIL